MDVGEVAEEAQSETVEVRYGVCASGMSQDIGGVGRGSGTIQTRVLCTVYSGGFAGSG